MSAANADRVTLWPAGFALGLCLAVPLLVSVYPDVVIYLVLLSLFALPLAIAVALAVPGVWVVLAIWAFVGGRRRRCFGFVVALLIFGTFVGQTWTDRLFLARLGDWEHFVLLSPLYLVRAASAPDVGSPRFIQFPWEATGFMSVGDADRFVAYDEADTLANQDSDRRQQWRTIQGPICDGPDDTNRPCPGCCIEIKHLPGHLYQVSFHET